MRAHLACLLVIVAAGCTRLNPAFNADGETGSETTPETSTDPTLEETGESGSLDQCELTEGKDLFMAMPGQCSEDLYQKSIYVEEVLDVHTLKVLLCTSPICALDAQGCAMGPVPLELVVDPLPLGDLVEPGACLHVVAQRRPPQSDPDDCNYQTAAIWEVDQNAGELGLVLVARGASDVMLPIPTDGGFAPPTPDFEPTPVYRDSCPCDVYDACCGGDVAPTLYDFLVDSGGNTTTVEVGPGIHDVDVGGRMMKFHPLNAWLPGSCESEDPKVAWGLTRPVG